MSPKASPTNDPNVGSILKYLAATPTHRTELEIHQPEAKSVESLLQLESAKENTKHEQLKTKQEQDKTKRVLGEAREQTQQEQDKTKRVLGQAVEQTKQEQDKTKRVLGQAVEQTKQEQEKTAQEKERTAQVSWM